MASGRGGLVGRLIALVVLGAIAVGGVVVYKQNQKARMGESLLAEFISDMSATKLDARSREYVEGLARRFHDEVYEIAFTEKKGVGGGNVNVNRYQREMADRIIAQAKADGSTHVAKALEDFKADSTKLDLSGEGG